jgi:Tfp pilus assembly PilM family ATPase/Tfp pilus assembly protein PilN
MSKNVLAIDVQKDRVALVLANHGLKGFRIVDSLCLNLAENRGKDDLFQDLKDILLKIPEKIGVSYDKCIVSIPAKHFFFRTIELPFKSKKNISQVLSFEIEPLLPCDMEDISIDFNLLSQNSKESADLNKASIASIQKNHMDLYKSIFTECEILPDVITVGTGYSSALVHGERKKKSGFSFFIQMESDSAALYAVKSGEIILARVFPLDIDDITGSVKKNIVHTFLAYNDLFQTNVDLDEILVAGSGSLVPGFCTSLEKEIDVPVKDYNLLKDLKITIASESFADHDLGSVQNAIAMCLNEVNGLDYFNFSKKVSDLDLFWNENKSKIIASVFLSLLLLLSLTIGPVLGVNKMEKRLSSLDTKIIDVFKSSFPEIQTIVDPLHQMRTQVDALKKKEKMDFLDEHPMSVDLMQEISKVLPSDLDIDFTRLVRTQTNLTISGSTDRFNTVDDMKSSLDKVLDFKSVEINSAAMDKSLNRVKFNLKILL